MICHHCDCVTITTAIWLRTYGKRVTIVFYIYEVELKIHLHWAKANAKAIFFFDFLSLLNVAIGIGFSMNRSGSDVFSAFVTVETNPYLSRRDFSLSCSLEMVSRHLVSSWRRSTTSERSASTSSSLVPDPGAWPFWNDLCELPRPFSVGRNVSIEIYWREE